ncbi:MAG: hypothetical protein HY831_01290 [Candidatus Aenigmarchaeota archaeon]|nr:hypothetical protein [Candidatus Aenigmarchaeota archaeon]
MAKEEKSKEIKNDYRKKWWNNDLKYSLVFLGLGIAMGLVSYVINVPLRAFLLSVVVFIISALVLNKVNKLSEGKGWWFSKFVVFIFLWFVTWTVFHTSCSIYNTLCL